MTENRNNLLWASALLLLVAVLVLAVLTYRKASRAAAQVPPVAWEYKIVSRADGDLFRNLGQRRTPSPDSFNQLGAEGWELVDVMMSGPEVGRPEAFIFKRPKK